MTVLALTSAVPYAAVAAVGVPLALVSVRQWTVPARSWTLAASGMGAALSLVAATVGVDPLASTAFVVWAIAVSTVDIACHRLPDALTLPAAGAVMVAAAHAHTLTAAVVGGLALASVYLLAAVLVPGSVGGGDVKLSVALGGLTAGCGGQTWVVAAATAPILTVILGVALRVAGPEEAGTALPHRGGTALPHGPSLCAATLVAWVSVGT